MTRLLKRLFSLAVIGAIIAGVAYVIMLPGVQEKIGGGRRARGGGDGRRAGAGRLRRASPTCRSTSTASARPRRATS